MAINMADILNTKKRDYQYNGPVESSDYNERVEENYKDLVYLYNKSNIIDNKLSQAFERVIKDHKFLSSAVEDLTNRVSALEATSNTISLHSFSQIDYSTLVGSSFAVSGTELLSFDPIYNTISLPKVSSGSFSKLKFTSPTAGQVVPEFFKAKIDTNFAGVDGNGAVIDTTPIYNAILDAPDKVWKRNVIVESTSMAGAQMMLYVKIPAEAAGSLKTNMIKINPYPAFGVDLVSIEYSSKQNPALADSDGWTPLNKKAYYDGTTEAIGKVPPGGWSTTGADTIRNCPPVAFTFPDTDITAIRIKFIQRNYFTELGKAIYTYGLSDLDIRYEKFLSTGRTIIKFTAPDGDVIENVTNVTPKIYNVPSSLISSAFSYRIIYNDSGTYTLSNPGASNSVWIEVTLNMLDDKTAPVLTDLIINYE
jgi:hypothetical protein